VGVVEADGVAGRSFPTADLMKSGQDVVAPSHIFSECSADRRR
jgi:hypothetical protein